MDELTTFQRDYFEHMKQEEKEELEKNAETINGFKAFMSDKGISLSDDNFKYCQTIGIVATYPNLITHLHDSLVNDKEGLLKFTDLCKSFERRPFLNGYLFADKYMLMAHPYFRRGFHEAANYAPRFVEKFWNHEQPDIEPYISIDPDRVRINVDNSSYMELDTWFGADFNRNIALIPDNIMKLRPPMDIDPHHISFFFNDAYSLDIKWATKNGVKSFQAEEFKTEGVTIMRDGIKYYPVRYIHAEYVLNDGYFRHFDGAIHFYTETEYYQRRDADFNYNFKNDAHIKTLSQKLFKMNGRMMVDTWIDFSCHFFTGNPLVFEYFEGNYPAHIKDMLEKVRKYKSGCG